MISGPRNISIIMSSSILVLFVLLITNDIIRNVTIGINKSITNIVTNINISINIVT